MSTIYVRWILHCAILHLRGVIICMSCVCTVHIDQNPRAKHILHRIDTLRLPHAQHRTMNAIFTSFSYFAVAVVLRYSVFIADDSRNKKRILNLVGEIISLFHIASFCSLWTSFSSRNLSHSRPHTEWNSWVVAVATSAHNTQHTYNITAHSIFHGASTWSELIAGRTFFFFSFFHLLFSFTLFVSHKICACIILIACDYHQYSQNITDKRSNVSDMSNHRASILLFACRTSFRII